MNQRVLLPSRRLVFLTTAAFAVTIGALFAATSCDLRPNVDLSSLKTDQKHDSCLLELSDGRWELMTDGYEPELVVGFNGLCSSLLPLAVLLAGVRSLRTVFCTRVMMCTPSTLVSGFGTGWTLQPAAFQGS